MSVCLSACLSVLSGKPKRVMTIAGHGSTISDLAFSADDCRIFSCSVDGTVYSHAVNVIPSCEVIPFTGEYFSRGAAAIKIVTNLRGVIIVCYDSRTSMGGHLAIWQSGNLSDAPIIVQLDVPVRDIALGTTQSYCGDSSQDICMIGAADGSILISIFPLPTVATNAHTLTQACSSFGFLDELAPSPSNAGDQYSVHSMSSGQSRSSVLSRRGSSPISSAASKVLFSDDLQVKETVMCLDCSKCKIFHLHCGPVSSVAISADGNRMFSSGEDGAVFMLSVPKPSRAKVGDMDEETVTAASIEMQSEPLRGNSLMLADKRSFEALRSHTVDIRLVMEEKQRDTEKVFSKLSEQNDMKLKELEARLKREVSKRDAIILNERENHQKQKYELTNEISNFEQKQSEILTRVELGYEQRLAQEALYLDRMRQVRL